MTCLSRHPPAQNGRAGWVAGDVLDAGAYEHCLTPGTTVVHLAAVTGKADRAAYQRTNAEGTRALVAAAVRQNVGRFVLVSSVAARYPNLGGYPYGASKRDAEAIVAGSGLSFLIVRPTIVLGAGSPIWLKLRQLAAGRLVPMIGNGRTRVQPIHVRDVATALGALAAGEAIGTIELGGAETLSIRELLERIHMGARHGARRTILPIPYAPLRLALDLLEKGMPGLLPITAGQLSLFVQDSSIEPDAALQALWPQMMNVDEMIRASENGHA